MPTTPESDYDTVTNEGLLSLLRNDSKNIVILDCRSSNEFSESHIRDAVNFSIPSIMLRRLAAGKIDLASTIKSRELKTKICSTYKDNLFVIYNDLSAAQHYQNDSVFNVLYRRLAQDGCHVVCLEGGFTSFRTAYPEWCNGCCCGSDGGTGGDQPSDGSPALGGDTLPLMGLRSLRISHAPLTPTSTGYRHPLALAADSSTDSSDADDRCDSSLGFEDDREFPVEILPYLFLGNAANSEDRQALAKHSIQYVLNVTPDLPNVFEDQGNIKYMQIPITDHWSQNLASHFPKAIEFIDCGDFGLFGLNPKDFLRVNVDLKYMELQSQDEARTNKKGVLVHCLAGVSRSVTITVAYLMYKCSLNLNDAFNVVRARKSNVAPNFHFMEQLHNFERELKLDVSSQSPLPLLEQMRQTEKKTKRNDRTSGGDQPPKQQPCKNCGLTAKDCKCKQHTEFLSPLAQIGVSPDSGIEFDRWGSGTPGE